MKSRGTLRVLVTGGAGFIGSHVVNRLVDRGDEVIVLDDLSTGLRDNVNPYAQLVVGSITDGQLVREAVAAVDACIHLAAIASVGRFKRGLGRVPRSQPVRVRGTAPICRAAAEGPDPAGVRVFRGSLRQFDPTSHLRNGRGAPAIGLRRRQVRM